VFDFANKAPLIDTRKYITKLLSSVKCKDNLKKPALLPLRFDLLLPASTAIALALLLFYTDEGRYNFEGVLYTDNVVFLIVYTIFVGFQLLVKMAWEHFIGTGTSQRVISGALAALSLLLALAIFFGWFNRPNGALTL
jgi:hypothetical protein